MTYTPVELQQRLESESNGSSVKRRKVGDYVNEITVGSLKFHVEGKVYERVQGGDQGYSLGHVLCFEYNNGTADSGTSTLPLNAASNKGIERKIIPFLSGLAAEVRSARETRVNHVFSSGKPEKPKKYPKGTGGYGRRYKRYKRF